MNDLLDFSGKVVLVTGSSRGIGAEIIKAFGKRGAGCVVNYVTDPEGQNKADAESVTFEQDYRSNGLSNVMKKRQYWMKEGGRWKILYEGAA